ncbi:unnamed protein product [Cylindrotheca closterium]|uniref:Uncharacterized protein n=1 Tax=Cylindrotheca closterium TaxID=2856 RepID=A0AAD2GCC5_9STRA|nr:unnamed protein product [Cylindrotheca closterium]
MHVPLSTLILVALVGHQADARLSGNRQLIGGLEGLNTSPPTSAYEMLNGQNNIDDPDADVLLGAGGHGEQITNPYQFDEDGKAIYEDSPPGEEAEEDNLDGIAYEQEGDGPEDDPLLGGGGHGQQITNPYQFDEDGKAIYEDSPPGEEAEEDNLDGIAYEQEGDGPEDDPLLGGGGHGQQITNPYQFDEDGKAIYEDSPPGEEAEEDNLDGIAYEQEGDGPENDPLLGGGGHGQQITDPNHFDEDGNAIYGDSGTNGTDDSPLLGGGGHGQQITDSNHFDEDGNAIYSDSGTNGTDDSPLLGGGGHGQQITDPNQFDEDGNAIYNSNPMNAGGTNGTDEFGDGKQFDGFNMTIDDEMNMDDMDMDNTGMDIDMDMMNGLNDTDSGNQNSTGLDGALNGNNDNDSPSDDTDGETDLVGADESINGDQDDDGNFPWDRDGSTAPSPAFSGGAGGGGLPSYFSPSQTPIGENNFGRPTYGQPTYDQNSYAPLPTLTPSKEFGSTTTYAPTSLQNVPTWNYPEPSSKPVAYIPPEERDDDYTDGEDDTQGEKDDMQGGSSIDGTGSIGDYIYFDHGEPIEEMEHDRNVVIALGICGGIGLCLAIITAQQMLENPHGCCAGMCRILVSATCGVTRCICWPCRKICGCTGRQERYSNELISGGGYNEEYISDLELT